jgi:lactate racemase
MIGHDSIATTLTPDQVQQLVTQGFDSINLDGKRVLVIIPDSTRTAPIPLMFRLLNERVGPRAAKLDFLIALGTHQPMTDDAIARLVGISTAERAKKYPGVNVFNHRWDQPEALTTIGTITRTELAALTGGLLAEDTPVRINKLALDYDHIIICGPVFPHEVVGFSGGAKYLFPGIAGAEIINFSHWLGALVTCMKTIGVKDTPVRKVIHRAAEFLPKPITFLAMVLRGQDLHGVYIGGHIEAWSAAADLSAQLNVITVAKPFKRVLSAPSEMYDDLWTAAKAMYKTESAIADGGEVIIYAPHLNEVSYTHGKLIDQVGYHCLDYFVKQEARFKDVPGTIKAHSTHVKGVGTYDAATGIETPRINVTLATGIPEERCRLINLGYKNWRKINVDEWKNREAEGILYVPHAGEMLYRA